MTERIEEKQITCISCPVGCRMTVTIENSQVVRVLNNSCKRGEVYGRQESISPARMVTAVARVRGSAVPISLKTQHPIPKDKIDQVMAEIKALDLRLPILMGDVLKQDVANTGVALLATRTLV